jgi:internalin A
MMTEMAKQELPDRFLYQIDSIRRGDSTTLDVSNEGLTEIPDAIFRLSSLTELCLARNELRRIPDHIRALRNLRRLDLTGNPIERLPQVPGLVLDGDVFLSLKDTMSPAHVLGLRLDARQLPSLFFDVPPLPNLEELYVFGKGRMEGRTADAIGRIARLRGLRILHLVDMPFLSFPPMLRQMRGLTELWIERAGLRECPDWLGELELLTSLGLPANQLDTLPADIRQLRKLTYLSLYDNDFQQLPAGIFDLRSLEFLDAASTRGAIREIPGDILRIEQLTALSLDGQPIETPPLEVVNQGVEAIKNYWRQRDEADVDYLCEAKLLIVGEAGAGKTSLARKVRDPACDLQDTSTEGIEVTPWSFPSKIRVNDQALVRNYRVNIWDFGGQEIYKSTHQFFLTRRSLYVLVADDRKEDTDFRYWLEIIELLSDGSPVVVIQNEKLDRRREIDFSALRTRYSNLREPYRVNLADNRGLEQAVCGIQREMESLPHIGAALPATWKRVRDALERDPRDYISQEEYFEICEREGFRRLEDKLQLSDYLHTLGICLHFQDDPILKHTIILNPHWGTHAVYRALDDKMLFERHGRFDAADVDRIWAEERYTGKQDELLRLMMRFQLCYQVPDSHTYIAPQLLPTNRVAYDWPDTPSLLFRYEYDFMPKGILTRLIVAMHHRIANDLVWKTGAVFERNGALTEVIEDYEHHQIRVRATGPDARGLVAIIDDHLQRFHDTFPKLKFGKHVPCNCRKCTASPEPYLFPLNDLIDFASSGDAIQCRSSRKMVDAAELVRDLFPSAFRPDSWRKKPAVRNVFVSYRHTDESMALVDLIESTLGDHGINLLRDRNEVRYRDCFRDFMKRLAAGDAVVVVISKAYLESENCIFELTEMATRGDVRGRLYPIVFPDANIYRAEGRLDYAAYWDQRTKDLRRRMQQTDFPGGAHDDLQDFGRYALTIDSTLKIISDMNALAVKGSMQALVKELEKLLT